MTRSIYYVVLDFMVFDLKLKGLEKDIYAIIYGFCQAGNSYTGSLQYLADWTQSTRQGVLKALKSLQEKGLIEKEEKILNNVKFCEYRVNGVKQSLTGVEQSLTGCTTEFNGGVQQSLTNNIRDKKPNNKSNNIDTAFGKWLESNSLFNNPEATEKLTESFKGYAEMRKAIKKPLTASGAPLMLNKAYKLANGNIERMAKIFDQSTMHSWQGVFSLKEESNTAQTASAENIIDYPF